MIILLGKYILYNMKIREEKSCKVFVFTHGLSLISFQSAAFSFAIYSVVDYLLENFISQQQLQQLQSPERQRQ